MSDNMGGLAILAMTQSVSAFTTFLPKISEVRKASLDDIDFAADVRIGETAAVIVSMGIATLSSAMTKSMYPVVIGALMCLLLIVLYEMTLTTTRPFEMELIPDA